MSPREPQTSILSSPPSFAYSVAPGNCGGAAGRRRRGRVGGGEGEPPGQRSPRAPGPAEGATMLWRHHHRPSQRLSHTHLRSRFPFMELGGVLRARRAPATGGQKAVQGATRSDKHSHSASRRGGDGFFSATALRKLSPGRAAVGRQHATRREEGEA